MLETADTNINFLISLKYNYSIFHDNIDYSRYLLNYKVMSGLSKHFSL